MLATRGLDWSRSSPNVPHLPDTTSPVYPDRPIRPLPKRPLKSRLSLEQAEMITFPPIPPSSSPQFGSPHNHIDRAITYPHYSGNVDILQDDHDLDHHCDCGGHNSGPESDESEEGHDRSGYRNSWPGRMRYPRQVLDRGPVRVKPPAPHSATSSADGYESFENTNNKKKRKIPISGAPGSGMTSDGSSMGIPTQSVDVSISQDAAGYYHGSPSATYSGGSGIGISGAGRGRNGKMASRPISERRPLVSSNNGANTMPNGSASDRQGIISAAIANAAENPPTSSSQGQENISLLQRQQQASSIPKDFTFKCPSDSATKLNLSAQAATSPSHVQAPFHSNRGTATQGTQTSPNGSRQIHSQPIPPAGPAQYPQGQQPPPPPPPDQPKPRRHRDSLRAAAQQRRAQQAYDNRQNPPSRENIYICEFCEYEAIFGHPPRALIRQYEVRDRQVRKKAEAQRRNLEKVKAKGRKNRKGAKGGLKNTAPASGDLLPSQSQHYDPRYDPPHDSLDQDSQGEDCADDRYDETVPLSSHHETVNGSDDHKYAPMPDEIGAAAHPPVPG